MQQLLYFLPSLLSVQVQSAEQSKGEQSELAQFSSEEERSFEMDYLMAIRPLHSSPLREKSAFVHYFPPRQPREMFVSSCLLCFCTPRKEPSKNEDLLDLWYQGTVLWYRL